MMLLFSVLSRNPPLSMGSAIWIGWCIKEGNAWAGFRGFFDTALSAAIDGYSAIFVFVFLMQMIVGAGHRSGGFQALADLMSKGIKDSFTCQFLTWVFGFVIFFDDYSNTQVVGACMLSVAQKMRVSKEKLAFTVDCTASPVASLLLVSTWIAYELSQIEDSLALTTPPYTSATATDVFMNSVPYRFYSWFMLFFVVIMAISGRDWGPMYYAELKARKEGWEEDKLVAIGPSDSIKPVKEKAGIPKGRWWNGAIVPVLFLTTILPFLEYSGNELDAMGGKAAAAADANVTWEDDFVDIIGNADSWAVLSWVGGLGVIALTLLYFVQWIPVPEGDDSWVGKKVGKVPLMWPAEVVKAGCHQMGYLFEVVWILIFAKAIANLSKDLGMPDYLGCALKGTDPAIIPAVTFVLACLCSLGTGTSWGTMAVMFPISIPLAINLCRDEGIEDGSDEGLNILYTTSAAVLGGSVWGDHCSIVSDTTCLAAAACQCSVFDHFKTQIPYAMYCGLSALLLGFLPTAYGMPAGLGIFFALSVAPAISIAISYIPGFGGAVPTYSPTSGEIGTGIWGIKASIMSYCKTPDQKVDAKTEARVTEAA
eukprot:CAMPEP_0185434984 /NCGR_PEP_ID=MMETSP1365-20130426/24843_1 /TAXON_ID=38817 /ORGANISM="Gephyrocapsa oceanica, Strain RCC1303" /LENGTH=593 /DNA_ID=CAMNT_0028039599 /DNA_START=179 /DNA_END=1960 /DNA_ORIENTATION=+